MEPMEPMPTIDSPKLDRLQAISETHKKLIRVIDSHKNLIQLKIAVKYSHVTVRYWMKMFPYMAYIDEVNMINKINASIHKVLDIKREQLKDILE